MSTDWKKAQEWEGQWHCESLKNPANEEANQLSYLEHMGLKYDRGGIDLRGKSVLDIGGGPMSLLLKTYNSGKRTVVDPLSFPQWIIDRYEFCDIKFINIKGEDILNYKSISSQMYDEVWIYNVLQHCENPELVIQNTKKIGKLLRIFEWIDVGVYAGHIHNLTKENLDNWIGQEGNISEHKWGERDVLAYSGVFDLSNKIIRISHPPSKRNPHMVFHIPGLAHTVTNDSYLSCAFTQKCKKLSKMLTEMGHTVYHYGCESSDPVCTENVEIVTLEEKEKFYPPFSGEQLWEYNVNDDFYKLYNNRAADAIAERCGDRDFLLMSWGWGHKGIEETLRKIIKGTKKNFEAVEPGVGYPDICTRFRAFESHAWRHYIYAKKGIDNGCAYDCVIPNYFDITQFDYQEKKQGYLLYLGRITSRKGVTLAVDIAKRSGNILVIAGQGTLKNDDEGIDIKGDHIQFAGFADVEKRRILLSNAKGLLMPTKYIEPFGGVSIEAMLSGTPVIATDWGAFPENIIHGKTGYLCNTMEQFVWAANNIDKINPKDCRDWAYNNFTMDAVAPKFKEWFNMLYGLWGEGFYQEYSEPRQSLDLYKRNYI
ncbi:MAG: Glycogen synthase [Firmicutes bacterium ADurb.Bin419]|nr:MAG: Glycogen synthase [Firmicutes bacterium ADurb.Bin419]